MRLLLYTYICQCCDTAFKAPSLYVPGYGPLLLRSTGDNFRMAFLSLHDPVADEVEDILKSFPEYFDKKQFKQIEIFQSIFGEIACDPDYDGFIYRAKEPKCIKCSVQDITQYKETNPPEFLEADIPEVTHLLWGSLSKNEKFNRAEMILKSRLA